MGADNCAHSSEPAHLAVHDQLHAAVRELDGALDEIIQSWAGAESRDLVPRETVVIALSRSIKASWTPGYTAELLAAAITRLAATTPEDPR